MKRGPGGELWLDVGASGGGGGGPAMAGPPPPAAHSAFSAAGNRV
jgi:hypothetical protein